MSTRKRNWLWWLGGTLVFLAVYFLYPSGDDLTDPVDRLQDHSNQQADDANAAAEQNEDELPDPDFSTTCPLASSCPAWIKRRVPSSLKPRDSDPAPGRTR